jgi:hypothetical protein
MIVDDVDHQIGEAALARNHGFGQDSRQRRRHGADGEFAGDFLRGRGTGQLVVLHNHLLHQPEDRAAALVEHRRPLGAVEQFGAQGLLNSLHLQADGRRRAVENLRRGDETAGFGNRQKRL